MTDSDIRALMDRIGSTYRRPDPRIVSPVVYRQRAECPLWTNKPNAQHVHNRDCGEP